MIQEQRILEKTPSPLKTFERKTCRRMRSDSCLLTVSVPMTLPPVFPDKGAVVGSVVGNRGEEGSAVCMVRGKTLGIEVLTASVIKGSTEGASVVGGTVKLTSPAGDVTVDTLREDQQDSQKAVGKQQGTLGDS